MSRIASLPALLAVAVISLPFLADKSSVVAASPRAAAPIGKQLAELKGSDTVAGNALGISVAISGTTALVGAPGFAKDAGRAYVFTNTVAGWKESAELKGSDTVAADYFGYSVAISGSTAVVGAPGFAKDAGRAYAFLKTTAGWKQVAELKGSDTVAADYFGYSATISGTTALVGAPSSAKNAGRAYVFLKTTAGWKQAAELKGSDTVAKDGFGCSVAISGTTAIVGAPGHAKGAGSAYLFTATATGWKQAAELKGSDTVTDNGFGFSVAISGMTAIAGAPGFAKAAGRAYVFAKTTAGWKQAAELKGSDTVASDDFGYTVAISDTTALAGAPGFTKNAGRAYVFTKAATGWKQAAKMKGSDTVAADYFGCSAAISHATALVGADGHAKSVGRAYVFDA
jgi:nucleoside-specific outer membrane channel protein Tsx